MADRYFKGEVKTLEGGVVQLFGSFTIGAAGAIASQACKGFSVVKTGSEVGRYRVNLEDSYNAILGAQASLVGAADAAYGAAGGIVAFLRNLTPKTAAGGWFEVQFSDAAGADANPNLDAVVLISVTLKNSTAF